MLAAMALTWVGCSGSDPDQPSTTTVSQSIVVDASAVSGTLRPLWRDHYDLSFEHFNYASEPGFNAVLADLAPRSWRCSIGRWEVGFPPPAGADSLDPGVLATIDREFYRGPPTMIGADDPLNYDFTYVDALLGGLVAQGVEPFLCFDYMPFTLAAEQDPANLNNANVHSPGTPYSTLSFSNGIRTSPPSDNAVYARVVRNAMRHARGLFAGTTDFGVEWFEVGNEPDLEDASGGALPYFWTGTEQQFYDMYSAVAAEVDADPLLTGQVQLGAGSFAFIPSMTGTVFLQAFLTRVAAGSPRIDYFSIHSYGDRPEDHLAKFMLMQAFTAAAGLGAPWVNAEWGRNLDGTEPAYDNIEHGLLRAKVLGLMQIFPFVIAHEALLRDPGTSGGELGLIKTGPPAHKPVSRVYQTLNGLSAADQALAVTTNTGDLYVVAGADVADTRVVVTVIVDEPAAGTRTRIALETQGLPWGTGSYDAELAKVTQSTSGSGGPAEVVSTTVGSGGSDVTTFDVPSGSAGLYVLTLTEQ